MLRPKIPVSHNLPSNPLTASCILIFYTFRIHTSQILPTHCQLEDLHLENFIQNHGTTGQNMTTKTCQTITTELCKHATGYGQK